MSMPSFCCPADMYICQVCGRILCDGCRPAVWRPDITGLKGAGNVCPSCLSAHQEKNRTTDDPPQG